jgi:hypothetical protein
VAVAAGQLAIMRAGCPRRNLTWHEVGAKPMPGTAVTGEQFELGRDSVLHKPTRARFYFFHDRSAFSDVSWGSVGSVLESGEDHRQEDVRAGAERFLREQRQG